MKKTFSFFGFFVIIFTAAIFISAALCGCNKADKSAVPTLIWWQIGGNSSELPYYSRLLSEYTEAKIGVRLEMRQGTWAGSSQRFNAMINTGEYFDILFSDANTFTNFASLGAFADISDLVKEAVPGLYYGMPEELWRGVSLGGKIYGVPTFKDSATTQFVFWDAALVEKYGLDIDDNTWQGWDANFKKLKEGEGQRFYPYVMSKGEIDSVFINYIELTSLLNPVGVRFDDPKRRVVCTLEQADVLEGFAYMHRWFENGMINPDANMVDTTPRYRPFFSSQAWPAVAASYATSAGIEKYLPSQYFGPLYSTKSIQGSINCISVNSKYKREALKLLELVNSDTSFRDMMAYGIEGDHFHYVTMPDGRKAVHRDRNDWPLINYQGGNYFIETPEDTVPAGYWDEVRYLNETAFPSYILGFTMDLTPVENEVINCRNTWDKYSTDLRTGAANPNKLLPVVISELRKKGMDKIIAEAQRQIDGFFGQ
jgi:putative aldouronate transport system substrate-binding protein